MQCMYIGPTVPGIVEKNRIFRGTLPERVRKEADGNPSFARLIIPVDDLVTARRQLSVKGSVLAVSFEEIQSQSGRK